MKSASIAMAVMLVALPLSISSAHRNGDLSPVETTFIRNIGSGRR